MSDYKLLPYQAYSSRTHGVCSDHPALYGLWCSMKSRCENPNRPKYKDYGARGIKVCEEWHDAGVFAAWAFANGYSPGLQIDRKDNNGDYCPENCRFVTPKENSRNRRNTKFLTVGGEIKCVSEWAEITGISPYTIYWWIKQHGKEYAGQRIASWNTRAQLSHQKGD